MEEKEIKNGDVYGKLDFDSDEKVVFPTEVTMVKIDNRDVELPVEALNAAGWRKVNDDENVVKKTELSEGEAEFMEDNEHLPFRSEDIDFLISANTYVDEHAVTLEDDHMMLKRLVQAYFCGYTVRETKYYIKFPSWQGRKGKTYLNVDNDDGEWLLTTKIPLGSIQSQFTQKEIDAMQQDERAKGFDLNALKVKVPDDELKD